MDKYLINAVALTVRHYRTKLNISQEQLAEKSGLDRTYISGVERGVRNITLDSLESIIFALDVPMSDFLSIVIEKLNNRS